MQLPSYEELRADAEAKVIGREAGQAMAEAVADGIERIILKLTDAIAQTRAEQAELRDEVHALSNRIESVARSVKL